MNKIKSKKFGGLFFASSTAVLQGFEGVLFIFLGLFFIKSIFGSFSFSVSALAAKELITIMILTILISPQRIFELVKMLFYRKGLWYFFGAGLFGTTIGNLTYILALQMAGPAYGGVLTSLYPIFAILINNLFFTPKKHKEKTIVWLGICISVIGATLFILLPSIILRETFTKKIIIGMIFGGVAGFFWAIEGLFINRGLSKKENYDLKINDGIAIRSFANVILSCFVLLPSLILICEISPKNTALYNPLSVIKKFFGNYQAILIILAIAVNVSILRNFHHTSVSLLGAKLTAVVDTNNFLITPLISTFLGYASLYFYQSEIPLFTAPIWWTWLLIIPIIIGVMLVLFNSQIKSKQIEKIV